MKRFNNKTSTQTTVFTRKPS